MKAYLVTTGTLFALFAVLHVWRVVAEWPRATVDAGFALLMAAVIAVPGVLSWWAWRLLRDWSNDQTQRGNEKTPRKDS
jgi:hypothetical protein